MTQQGDNARARLGDAASQSWSSRIAFAGAILVGVSFILSACGRWVGWPWLRFAPYAMMLGVAVLLAVGLVPIYRAMFTEFGSWFREASARNERRARTQASVSNGEGGPPAA